MSDHIGHGVLVVFLKLQYVSTLLGTCGRSINEHTINNAEGGSTLDSRWGGSQFCCTRKVTVQHLHLLLACSIQAVMGFTTWRMD
jgi:hypothetical protein